MSSPSRQRAVFGPNPNGPFAGQRRAFVSPDVAPANASLLQELETCTNPARRWPAASPDYFRSRVLQIRAHRAERLRAHPPECSLDGCV